MYIYILHCEENCLYTGIATDPEKRLRQHLGHIKGGAKFTASHKVKCVAALWEDKSGIYARSLEGLLKNRLTHADKLRLCREPHLGFSEFGIDIPDDSLEYISPAALNEKYDLKKEL